MSSEPANPFEAPEDRPARRFPAPTAVEWLGFALQRSMLGTLALLAVVAAAQAQVPRPALAALPVIALWAPTSAVILVSRYLSRAWDEQPVVLQTGLMISRRDFRAWIAAQAAEGVLAGLLILVLAARLLALPVSVAWLAPAFAAAGAYAISARVLRVRLARGVVALAEGDPEAAMRAVAPILAWHPLGFALVPSARLVRVRAWVLAGDPDAALAECDRIRVRGAPAARLWRALLTAERDPEGALAALEPPPRVVGDAWLHALIRDVVALGRGELDALLAQAGARRALAARLGPRALALSSLIDSAMATLAGEVPRLDLAARGELRWVRAAWPRLAALATATDTPDWVGRRP